MSETTTFSARLRLIREKRGFTQVELGETSGIPSTTIAHLEGGDRKPSFDNLKRLADALDVSTDYLLCRADNPDGTTNGAILFRNAENLSKNDIDLARSFVEMLVNRGKNP